MKLILLIGQSNMVGRGYIHEVPAIYNERIQVLTNARWQMMVEPVHHDRPVAGIVLAPLFAGLWTQDNDGKIGLIPCAEGGSSIDEWDINGNLFKNAITQAKFAIENSELIAILWHQGESDSQDNKFINYQQKLQTIISKLRYELNCPEIPLIIGGLPDFLGKSGFGASCTEYQNLNNELINYAATNPNTTYVSAQGLTANPDGIHIDAQSIRKFGLRYYQSFKSKNNIFNINNNEQQLIDQCYSRKLSKNERTYIATLKYSLGEISFAEVMATFSK